MPSAGFEPAITTIERPQTYALNCTATGIGPSSTYGLLNLLEGKSNVITKSVRFPFFWDMMLRRIPEEQNPQLQRTETLRSPYIKRTRRKKGNGTQNTEIVAREHKNYPGFAELATCTIACRKELIFTEIIMKFLPFMEPKHSLQYSQQPTNGLYPKQEEFSPHPYIICL
jgi:hypothetical protein